MDKRILTLLFAMLILVMVNCTSEKVPVPNNCTDPPDINLGTKTDASCNLSDGSVSVIGTGGEGTLMYAINGSAKQVSPTFSGLSAGSYTITVSDDNNCSSELVVDVVNTNGLNIEVVAIGTACGDNNGSITVNATGATGAVEYQLNENPFQNSNQFAGLPQGGFTITARDANGCVVEQEVDIESDIVFGDIQSIVQTNCAISGCHNGTQAPDFRVTNNILGRADRIMARTGQRTMPPGGRSISNAQIEAIACWVEDGAKGN